MEEMQRKQQRTKEWKEIKNSIEFSGPQRQFSRWHHTTLSLKMGHQTLITGNRAIRVFTAQSSKNDNRKDFDESCGANDGNAAKLLTEVGCKHLTHPALSCHVLHVQ